MNGAWKGKSCKCMVYDGLLLLLMFDAEKKSDGRGLKLENMWIGKLLHYEGFYGSLKTSCGGTRDMWQHNGEIEIGGCVSCF